MKNNMNNPMMMNNNINQMGGDKTKELLEEIDYMTNKVNLYEKRIKTLEERIKEKDSEIIKLKNMLSGNFNYNPGMLPINYDYNQMMMGQMNCMNSPNQANNSNKMEKEKIPKFLKVKFIIDGDIIAVYGKSDMTIEMLIKNFIVKLCIDNFSGDYFFKGNKIDKDSTQTLIQSGISNEDEIYVFEQNDKNQKEKMSKMLSHKHDNITITFNASSGYKVLTTVCHYTKISKILKAYSEKLLIGKIELGKDIMFLYNGAILDIHDNRTIAQFSGGKDKSFLIQNLAASISFKVYNVSISYAFLLSLDILSLVNFKQRMLLPISKYLLILFSFSTFCFFLKSLICSR